MATPLPVLHAPQRIGTPRLAARMVRRRSAYRNRRLLADPQAHRDLAVHGFHLAAHRVPPPAVAALIGGCEAWLAEVGPLDGQFRSSYTTLHQPAGERARGCVIEHLLPVLRPHLAPGAFLRPSVYQVKPSAPESGLRLHQDRALVDERRSFTLHAWVALTDVTLEDGPLVVLPGSHRFGSWSRVPTPEDPLGSFQEAMERHAVALAVPAGQVVWFDAALVHGSLVNVSGATRLGVSAVASHRDDPHSIAGDPGEPDGRSAKVHEVDAVATVRVDPPPVEAGRVIGTMALDDLRFPPSSLAAVARAYRVLHPGAPGVPIPHGSTCLS